MTCWPQDASQLGEGESGGESLWGTPRRDGAFADRIAALRESERQASDLRSGAEIAIQPFVESMALGIAAIAREVTSWPETDVRVHPRIEAVPEAQRSRRPGVAGERVHIEKGFMLVVDAIPTNVRVILASIALQVLDGGQVRLHGTVTTENIPDTPAHRVERWRWMREADASSTGQAFPRSSHCYVRPCSTHADSSTPTVGRPPSVVAARSSLLPWPGSRPRRERTPALG